jgi:hypothetical protein
MGWTDTETKLAVAGIAAGAAIAGAMIAAIAAYLSTKRDRRRLLYGEAFKAALGWQEMLYRVRRRAKGGEAAIVDKSHDLQEELTYYEGWMGSESKYMARSYRRLVRAVKQGTESHITTAWSESIRPVPGNATEEDVHPRFQTESDGFLRDVRAYLSPWQWRKFGMMWRNRKSKAF